MGTALVVALGAALGPPAHASVARESGDPVLRAIAHGLGTGQVSAGEASSYRRIYLGALGELGRLHGTPAHELGSAVAIVRSVGARGSLIPSRMPFVFLTLKRNAEWWAVQHPPSPSSGTEPAAQGRQCKPFAHDANLTFPGSGVVFEYYPGMGLQLQVNATFGTANGLLTEGTRRSVAQAETILDEMLPLASYRAGLETWEYEFPFEGALPPWTSGLSQATAIDAYTRAGVRLGRRDFLAVALRLARLFAASPPLGVRTHMPGGDWFLLYSFDPGQIVLNADLDAVIALHDLRVATHSPFVSALAHSGLHALEDNLWRFDTGKWSLYAEGGPLADLNYHALNLELAQKLCQRTNDPVVCGAADSFERELNAHCPVVSHAADEAIADEP